MYNITFVFRLFFLVVLMCSVQTVLAETAEHNLSLVVRLVKASGTKMKATSPDIDERLSDLKDNLVQLPYQNFEFVSVTEVPVKMQKKKTIHLAGDNTLDMQLLYIDPDRTGMRVHWTDENGSELLDSRLHFRNGDSVVVGTDANDDDAYIMALGIKDGK